MDMLSEIKRIVDDRADEALDILMYYPLRDEVDLRPLFYDLRDEGHHLYFPVTEDEDMEFYEVKSLDDFVPGALGISEPDRMGHRYRYEKRKTICLTPGTRFSQKLQRKGRGKGYYDRFFADKEDIFKIGVTTESRVIPEMESNPWDVDMDVVVTEDRII